MSDSSSGAGDRKNGSGVDPNEEGTPRGPGEPAARPLPPPPPRVPRSPAAALPPVPAPVKPPPKPASPPAAGRPPDANDGGIAARLSLTDLDVPTRERAALPAATAAQTATSALLDLDVPTRERAAIAARPAELPTTQDAPSAAGGVDPASASSDIAGQPDDVAARPTASRAAAFTSSDAIGMLGSPTSEPLTVEIELPAELEAPASTQSASLPDEPDASALDSTSSAEAEASADSFLSSASLKSEEARRLVAENAARVRAEREASERLERERQRQARQPETIEQRRQRALLRMRTTREAMRLLGFMGISDEMRVSLDAAQSELEGALLPDAPGSRPSADLLDATLQACDSEGLDRVERYLTQLEDCALQADATVARDVFRERASSGKHSRKVLMRYGRLLATRRFSADQRRDRFEYLATQLLTQPDEAGRLAMLPKDQARTILQHLIGGLPQIGQERDREDAVTYLKDALSRLAEFTSAEAFFESGFYLDVHGYKVSMRDQLTGPDFLYLSALLSARVHNRLEDWIADKEKDIKPNQLTQDGSPRERIMGMLREQEQTVQSIFGAPTTAKEPVVRRAPPKTAPKPANTDREKEKEKWRKRKAKLAAKGEVSGKKVAGLSAIIVTSALIVLRSTGHLEIHTRTAVESTELRASSPLLVRGYVESKDSTLYAEVKLGAWQSMDDKARRTEAEAIAAKLAKLGVEHAQISAMRTVVIRIDAHRVAFVQAAAR